MADLSSFLRLFRLFLWYWFRAQEKINPVKVGRKKSTQSWKVPIVREWHMQTRGENCPDSVCPPVIHSTTTHHAMCLLYIFKKFWNHKKTRKKSKFQFARMWVVQRERRFFSKINVKKWTGSVLFVRVISLNVKLVIIDWPEVGEPLD